VSWKIARLAEICDIKLGKTPSRSDKSYWDDEKLGSNIWVSIADLTKLNSRFIEDSKEYITDKGASLFKPVKAGTLLMSFKLSIGKLAYANCDLYTNEAIVALPIKDKNKIDSDFLFYFLQFYDWDKETENDVKLKGKTLNKAKLNEIAVPLPPLSIQKKIVTKLDAIFAEIDKAIVAAEANAKNAEVIFYSILNKLLDENKTGWSSLYLKDACEFINRGISPSYLENDNEGILILNQKCVRNHKISFDLGRRHDVIKKQVKEERLIRYGDVLVNSTGTGTLGRVAQVVDEILEPTTVDSHVTIVRPNLNKFSANFFGFMMIQIEDDIKKAGEGSVGQTELSRTTLSEKFKVVFPNDKKLQDSLYLQLTTAKENSIKVKRLMELKLKELIFLKQSILKQAFNGELIKE